MGLRRRRAVLRFGGPTANSTGQAQEVGFSLEDVFISTVEKARKEGKVASED